MKQSQNAITFLSAQYRAVYGRAYVKGLASAMVLTTALFGSYAAHAANSYTAYGGDSWDNSVDHDSQEHASGASYNRIEKGYYNNININRPNTDAGITDIKLKGELNIAAGNSAGLAGYDNVGRTIYGWDNAAGSTQTSADAVGDLNNSGLFNIGRDGQSYPNSKSSQAHFNQVNLNTGSETGLRGLTDSNQAIDDYTTLAGGYGSGGVFNVASGSITHLKNNTQFKVAQGSTGTFDGQINFIPNRNGTNSFIRGEDNYSVDENGNKIWNQNGAAANIVIGENATLNVFNNDSSSDPNQTETGTAGIYAANTNINGTISLSGKQNFVLDGDFIDTSKSAADAGHGAGNFVVSDTAKIKLAEGSHLIVGNGSYDSDNPATADVNEAEQETTLDLTKAASGALTGEGVIETRGTTLLTETVLDEFVKPSAQDYADNPADTDSAKWKEGGKFKLRDGTLEIKSADAAQGLNLKKYILRGSETTGSDIVITGTDNTIKSDHLEVTSHIGFKDNLTLEADKLTLGGEQTASFNVKQLVAHDEVVFKDLAKSGANADNRFVTGDNLIINAVGNGSGDKATTSGNAIFVGNSNIQATDPDVEFDPTVFQVAGGEVTHTGSLAANWGAEVKIGGADGSTDEHIKSAAGHDASLTIASGSGAEFRVSEATVNIVGNGSGATSTLDISNVSRDKTNFNKLADDKTAKINIGTDGNAPVSDARMVINDRQLDKMFNVTRGIRVDAGFSQDGHNKGANVVIGSTGTLEIKKNASGEATYSGQESGNYTADQVQLDVSLLRNGDQNTDENNFIYFKNGGRLEADNLQLMHESYSTTTNAASHVLDIGHGTVAADKLELRHRSNSHDIVVSNGTLEVGSKLSSFVNANATEGPALVLGDNNTAAAASGGANLNLGTVKYTANADANGLHDGTYTYASSSSGGTINTDVVLNGKTAADATLNVNVGKWTLGDSGSISFASGNGTLGTEGHGTINIGMSQDDILDPDKPVSELTAELNIGQSDMTVTEGNALNINDTGLGNFDKYTVASGATSRIDGVLNVNTADFSDAGAEITGHGRINVGGASGAGGTPVTSGSLAISKENFDNFIGDPDGDGNNGQILFREDSTLDFSKEQAQVELGNYDLAEQAADADPAADINLVSGKHLKIKGNDISINSALTDPGVTANVDINTTKLSLGGGNGFVSSSQALGVKSLNTHDVTFVNDKDDTGADTGNAFSLKDELNLTGQQPQGQLLPSGTSTGNVIVAQGGKYNVKDGLYTHSGDFGLNGGQVNIDNSATNQSSLIPVSSLRVVSGDIVIDNSNAANTIKIAGTAGKQNSAALDLSQAGDLTVTRGQNLTTIDVGTEAQFTLNGAQATNLLSGAGSTDSGAGVLLSDTGEMLIKGDMTLDTSSLAAGTAAQSDKIIFNNGGTVTVNGQVTLTNNNNQAAALGQGSLNVNGGLALSGAADTNFTLAQGKVDVSATAEPALTSHTLLQGNDGQKLNIGDGTTSGDAVISFHGTDAAQDFTLAADLGLNGNGDNKVTVNLDKGNFKAQNITVSGAQNTIDLDGSAQGAVTANLTGKDLSVGESGSLNIEGASGDVTFENVTLGSGSTLALNNERFTVSGGTGDFSSGTVTGTADLTITGAQAVGSLKTENFTTLLSGGADITLDNGGDLNLSGDTNTDLTQFTYDDVADGTGSGDVHVIASTDPTVENSKITGKNLTISKELTSGNGLKLDVEAESLTLGSTGYDSTADTDGLGLDKLHAQNVNFVAYEDTSASPATTKDFTLRDQLNLRAPAADDGSTGTGTISGNVVLAGGADNALNIQEGNYTDAGNVHLNSGAITIGNADGLSGDASLALSGNLNIDNSTGDNTITVAANAEGGDSRLDINGANLQVTSGDGTKLTTVNVGTTSYDPAVPDPETPNAHFELTGTQLDTLLNSGSVGVVLGASGEIDAQSGDVSLSTDDLVVGSGATAGKIAFNNGGTLHTDNLALEGSGDVNIGLGTIDTNKLAVNNTSSGADTATLGSGNYLVADQLSSTNANIALGNGSNLTLGDFELDTTNVDHPDTAVVSGSLAANPGTISSNLVLNSGSQLNVQQGNWTLNGGSGDLTATNANIVIGAVNAAGEAYQVYDDQGSGNVVSASLAGNNLNLTESTLDVKVSGKADFNGIDTSSGSGSTLNIAGDVSIANSVKLNSGDQINITGANGWMRFEDQAAHNLTANDDGSTLNVNAGTFDNVFDLQSGGHLELELGDQTFSLAQIQELRKTLLSDADASGSVMDPGQHGYIHLGGAKVTGVGSGDGSMIPVEFDKYNPTTGEFTPGTMPPIASGDTGTGTGGTGGTGGAEGQSILALSADNKDAMDLLADIKDIRTDLLDDILLYDINTETENDVVTGNVGALMVNDANRDDTSVPKHAEIGDATLAHAYAVSGSNGNRQFISDQETGALLGANVQSGGFFNLQNGGYIGDITLEDGKAAEGTNPADITTLVVQERNPDKAYASGDGGVTYIASISGGANTAFINNDVTHINSGSVTVGNLQNTSELTIDSGDLTVSGGDTILASGSQLTVNGNTTLDGNNITIAGTNTFNGSLDATGNDVTVSGANTVSGDASFIADSGSVYIYGEQNISGSVTLESSGVTDTDVSKTSTTWLYASSKLNVSGDVTTTGTVRQGTGSTITANNLNMSSGDIVNLAGNNTFTGSGSITANDLIQFAGQQSFSGDLSMDAERMYVTAGSVSAQNINIGALDKDGHSVDGAFNTLSGSSVKAAKDLRIDTTTNTIAGDVEAGNRIAIGGKAGDSGSFTLASGGSLKAGENIYLNLSNNTIQGEITATGALYTNGSKNVFDTTSKITANNVRLAGTTDFYGTGTITDKLTTSGTFTVHHGALIQTGSTDYNGQTTINGTVITGVTNIGNASTLSVLGHVESDSLTAADSSSVIAVGRESYTDENGNTVDSATGSLQVGTLKLNGATLFVDPDYDRKVSMVAITGEANSSSADGSVKTDASGKLDGNLVVGKNSAVAWGEDLKALQADIANYQSQTGALKQGENDYGAILVVNKPMVVADGSRVIVDSAATSETLTAIAGSDATNAINTLAATNSEDLGASSDADMVLSERSAVIVKLDNGATDSTSAFHFEKENAKVQASNGATVVLSGNYDSRKSIALFSDNDADASGVELTGSDLNITSKSGILKATLAAGSDVQNITLQVDQSAVDQLPVTDDTKDIINNWQGSGNGAITGDNSYLQNSIQNDATAIDPALRLGVYGGAVQSAMAVSEQASHAMLARAGIGQNGTGSANFKNNGNVQIWANPVYAHQESDGFNAGSQSYGSDMDLYGLNAGAELSLTPNIKVGVVANVGTGSADGNGMASGVSNDFDYYGAGAYVAANMDNVTVVGDVSYSKVSNDISANTSVDHLDTSLDSTNLSVGVTGKLDLNVGGTKVSPYVGLRYQRLDLDDYGVRGKQNGQIANYQNDTTELWSVPFGIAISKDYITDTGWQLRPSLDLHLKANLGDDDASGKVSWLGTNAVQNVSSEVVDPFSYGVNAGFSAKNGNFSLGAGVSYTGSENTDEVAVQANLRYDF